MSAAATLAWLDALGPVDWTDLEAAHDTCHGILARLAGDREALRALVARVVDDPRLMELSEDLHLDDKLVLYEALADRGFRIRLHVSKGQVDEVPHDHRFPFTSYMLSGGYLQRFYEPARPLDELTTPEDLRPTFVRLEDPGACYTIDEDFIHSNIALPDTVLLLLRGPSRKQRAWGLNKRTGAVYSKLGAADEGESVRARHAMTRRRYDELVAQLERIGIL